jgi:hypothetical protein
MAETGLTRRHLQITACAAGALCLPFVDRAHAVGEVVGVFLGSPCLTRSNQLRLGAC